MIEDSDYGRAVDWWGVGVVCLVIMHHAITKICLGNRNYNAYTTDINIVDTVQIQENVHRCDVFTTISRCCMR